MAKSRARKRRMHRAYADRKQTKRRAEMKQRNRGRLRPPPKRKAIFT